MRINLANTILICFVAFIGFIIGASFLSKKDARPTMVASNFEETKFDEVVDKSLSSPNQPEFTAELNDSNQKIGAGTVLNGKRIGKWEFYYSTGELRSFGGYDNVGQREGLWRHYYKNGSLYSEGLYENGFKNGIWILYHSNGNIRTQGKFHDDKMIGEWKAHPNKDDPSCFWVGDFEDGKRDGEWKWFEGTHLKFNYVYKDGELISKTEYSKTGEVVNKTTKDDDDKDKSSVPTDEVNDAPVSTYDYTPYRIFRRRYR